MRRARHAAQSGLTLLEVLVATSVLIMVATMIWGAFDQTSKMRDHLAERQENDHLVRVAISRIERDLRSAFLSLHVNQNQQLATSITHFVGRSGGGGAQLDFTTFTHRRLRRGTHEGDACEVGYRLSEPRSDQRDPNDRRRRAGRFDLMRRESPRIDVEPTRGGTIDVLVPGVSGFDLSYWDEATERWTDAWDTSSTTGQPGRLPMRVRITVALDEANQTRRYTSETPVYVTRPLTFGLPIY